MGREILSAEKGKAIHWKKSFHLSSLLPHRQYSCLLVVFLVCCWRAEEKALPVQARHIILWNCRRCRDDEVS